jgi:mono/diheme cytochrome c family protein
VKRSGLGVRHVRSAAATAATAATAAAIAGAALTVSACGGSSSVPANASPGQKVFAQASCGNCHTLSAAGSTGSIGPDLNGKHLTAATVEHYVRNGDDGMPSFRTTLGPTQIQQIATFVAGASQ